MKAPRPQALRTSQAIGPGIAIAILIAMGVYSYFDGEAYRSAALQAEQSRLFVQRLQRLARERNGTTPLDIEAIGGS